MSDGARRAQAAFRLVGLDEDGHAPHAVATSEMGAKVGWCPQVPAIDIASAAIAQLDASPRTLHEIVVVGEAYRAIRQSRDQRDSRPLRRCEHAHWRPHGGDSGSSPKSVQTYGATNTPSSCQRPPSRSTARSSCQSVGAPVSKLGLRPLRDLSRPHSRLKASTPGSSKLN